MKRSTHRRIVTANVDGKSVVESDEQLKSYEFSSVPGYEHTLVWVNPTIPDLRNEQRFNRYPESVVPGPGGTSLHVVTFPPSSVFTEPSFDGEAAQKEALVRLRGLADHFEKDDPAMHRTNTVDYSIGWEGEMWLELDNGKTIHLERGDIVVQNGTRHAWRNKGTDNVVLPERRQRVKESQLTEHTMSTYTAVTGPTQLLRFTSEGDGTTQEI